MSFLYIIIIYENIKFIKKSIKYKSHVNKGNNIMIKNKDAQSKLEYYKNYINDIPFYQHSHIYSNNIYWCWLQGIDNSPELYRTTFNSVKKNCHKHNIIIINETNINEYAKFPSYIIEKYKNNTISNTHFSDLLRLELLIKYGGTWIDASVLITKYEEKFFKKDLFFFNLSNWFITSEKDSPVLKTTRDLLYEYWRRENYLFYYFIFHEFLAISYQRYKKDHLNMPDISNIPEHSLQRHLIKKINDTLYSDILKNASIHKLNIKFINKYFNFKDSLLNHIMNIYSTK